MHFLAFQVDKVERAATSLLSPASILSLPELAAAFVIAFAFLAHRQLLRRGVMRPLVILRAMIARRLIFNRSTGADLFYYFVNTFAISGLIGWGILSAETVCNLYLRLLGATLGPSITAAAAPEWLLRLGMTLIAFLGYEFGYYLDHYLKHRIPFLWEFHKTHHSAEVLTPLTVFRVHPVDTLIFVDIVAMTTGLFQGMFAYAVGKPVGLYVIDGTNVVTVAFLFVLAHLQHSQFWIPLRGLAGRLFLSPAHHQIHHSIDPAHYGRNLGSFLAIFDWAFGTLSIPEKERPHLQFGVAQAGDPHRIKTLLLDPVGNALKMLGLAAAAAGRNAKVPLEQVADR